MFQKRKRKANGVYIILYEFNILVKAEFNFYYLFIHNTLYKYVLYIYKEP